MADTDDQSEKEGEGASASDPAGGGDQVEPPQLLTPPNKILRKLSIGGDLKEIPFEPAVLKAAQKRADAMRGVFEDVVQEDLDRLNTRCGAAERDAELRPSELREIQLIAHEMIGYGASIGLDLLSVFADSLSKFLKSVHDDNDLVIKVMRLHVDSMRLTYSRRISREGEEGQALSTGLSQAVGKVLSRG